jgi:hypothetical protein
MNMTRLDAWTQAEDDLLRELWPTYLRQEEISERIGRSRNACKRRAAVLHITGTRPRGPAPGKSAPPPKADKTARNRGTAWTAEEDQRLRRLLRDGMSMERVAPLIGRSESSIDNRAKFLGMARRTLPSGERQWYDPLLGAVPKRGDANRVTASDAAWKDPERKQPSYGERELADLWLAAMARVSSGRNG